MASLRKGNVRHRRAEARKVAKAVRNRRIDRAVVDAIHRAVSTGPTVFVTGAPGLDLSARFAKAAARHSDRPVS